MILCHEHFLTIVAVRSTSGDRWRRTLGPEVLETCVRLGWVGACNSPSSVIYCVATGDPQCTTTFLILSLRCHERFKISFFGLG